MAAEKTNANAFRSRACVRCSTRHDVHDADPANEEAHRGNRAEEHRQQPCATRHGLRDLARVEHVEVVFFRRADVPPLPHQRFDARLISYRISKPLTSGSMTSRIASANSPEVARAAASAPLE